MIVYLQIQRLAAVTSEVLTSPCPSQCKTSQKPFCPQETNFKNQNLSQAIYLKQLKEKLCGKDGK